MLTAPPRSATGRPAFQTRSLQPLIGRVAIPLQHKALISCTSLREGSVIGSFSIPPPDCGLLIGWLVGPRGRCAFFGCSASGPGACREEIGGRERIEASTSPVQGQPLTVTNCNVPSLCLIQSFAALRFSVIETIT